MPRNNQYLIISQSGRALAASAKRAGIITHVIDLFADQDTIENTSSNVSVTGFSGGNNSQILFDTVAAYFDRIENLKIVIGSGFEDKLNLLATLKQRFPVIANDVNIIRQVKDPAIFFNKLKQLELHYPEYFPEIPDIGIPDGPDDIFLKKNVGGAGGGHVGFYEKGMTLNQDCYLQAFINGKNYSVTFIADGGSFHVLGINETWVCNVDGNFVFAGAVSNASLPDECCREIIEAIGKLVPQFHLRGLCSLDFVVDETGQYSILEINPRPTASFELYEEEFGLFVKHLAAFSGEMTEPEFLQAQYRSLVRALGVLYARESITIPPLEWPDWVTDRPKPGKHIAKGEPVCTVHAEGDNVKIAKDLLKVRLTEQRQQLGLSLEAA